MEKTKHISDPRGLIHEAYRMEGITAGECRSVFLDWALGFSVSDDIKQHAVAMLTTYGHAVSHPMTAILREAVPNGQNPTRKGGQRRNRNSGQRQNRNPGGKTLVERINPADTV